MTIKVLIQGNNGKTARVSNTGELVVHPPFSQATRVILTVDNTPLNFVKARALEKLIITGIIVNTNRDIGVNGALVEIYEASSVASSTVDKGILSFDLVKNQTVVTAPLFIETTQGKFINAKASDSEVNITLLGFFVG